MYTIIVPSSGANFNPFKAITSLDAACMLRSLIAYKKAIRKSKKVERAVNNARSSVLLKKNHEKRKERKVSPIGND